MQPKKFIQKWKAFAKKSSDIIARVMLFLFYFIVFTPYTLLVRLYKPLLPSLKKETYWIHEEKKDEKSYYEQY